MPSEVEVLLKTSTKDDALRNFILRSMCYYLDMALVKILFSKIFNTLL